MSKFPDELVKGRQYVLQSRLRRNKKHTYSYYTGNRPTSRLHKAKLFSLKYAKATKQFADTGLQYEVKRITQKMLFKSALQG